MAGGKETPRQKMVGMMYLVLTALLALNVSKAILDAFVAIEDNIQVANENEFYRGEEKLKLLKERMGKEEPEAVRLKAIRYSKVVAEIDRLTAERIKTMDDLKLRLLNECGEDVKSIGEVTSIVQKAYTSKDPLKPARLNLENVQAMDKYDEAMRLLLGPETDVTRPTGEGMRLFEDNKIYRDKLIALLVSSASEGNEKYSFIPPKRLINKNEQEKMSVIQKMVNGQHISLDDKELVVKMYAALTKRERFTVHEVKNVHWLGKTFDHAPVVAAIASITSLQKEILTARADAIATIQERLGGGEYSFNKIMALANGPEIVNQGDEFNVNVLMAAYDSERQPEVTVTGGEVSEINNGIATIRKRATGGEMKLNGTITIQNKRGVRKTLNWEKQVKVMQPSGTISQPELNVLYRGYDNQLMAVASGYDETILTSSQVSLRKSGKVYITQVKGGAKTVDVVISGKSNVSGKTERLGVFTYRVLNKPVPSIFVDGVEDGGKINRAINRIQAKYNSTITLNSKYSISQWRISSGSIPRSCEGKGEVFNKEAKDYLRQLKPGAPIQIETRFIDATSGMEIRKTVSYTVI